jgi:hypothetical protein
MVVPGTIQMALPHERIKSSLLLSRSKQQTNLTTFLQLIPTFIQSFSINVDAKLDTVDESDKVVVDPPRKLKKADKDLAKKIVLGKASMALP